MEVRLEVRGQMEDMVVTVVLLRLVTACDSWLDICQERRNGDQTRLDADETAVQQREKGDVHHVGAVAGGFVRLRGGGGLAWQGRGGTGGIDALLLLTAVAEPDPDHFLLHVELLCDQQDLL